MIRILVILLFVCLGVFPLKAQFGPCDPSVPEYYLDLTGNPDSIWVMPNVMRDGTCCGYNHPPNSCVKFIVTLDANAQGITFNVTDGALPQNLEWQLMNSAETQCDPVKYPAGVPVCLDGQGPHVIIFCKPGGNNNTYEIASIASPSISGDLILNDGCSGVITATGFNVPTLQYNSISPGAFGAYNNILSCASACTTTTVTAQPGYPDSVVYQVCGVPIGSCYATQLCDTVTVHFNPALLANITPVVPMVCYGNTTTNVTAQPSGGYPPYNFQWSTGDTGPSVNLSVGSYTVTISDATDCPAIVEVINVAYNPSPAIVNAGVDLNVCSNSIPVSLSATVAGATGVNWYGGNGTFSPGSGSLSPDYNPTNSEIASGGFDLYVTTTGNTSCPADTDTVHVNIKIFLAAITDFHNASCFGTATGDASAFANTASPPLSYIWSNGALTSSVSNLTAGNYTVTVTDNAACEDILAVTISQPTQITANIQTSIIPCQTTAGSATVFASGGFPGYTYLWSDALAQTTQVASNLYAGYYYVTVTDATSCSNIFGVAIDNSGPPLVTISDSVMVSCYNGSNGSATCQISSGTPPHTYLWSDAAHQTTAIATGLTAGTYTVVVTDNTNCVSSDQVTISQPLPVTSLLTAQNVSCFGSADGSVSATASGGTSPYSYLWSNGQGGASLNGLASGWYFVTITDNKGCTKKDSIRVIEPLPMSSAITNVNNVTCFGLANGSATIAGINGTAPYNFVWSTGQLSSSISGLAPGNYEVTVTDSKGCVSTSNATISQPDPMTISGVITNVNCYGALTGSVDLTVNGGNQPYLYGWSNGNIFEDLMFVGAGTYNVAVYDINGCSASNTYTISQPNALVVYSISSNISCFGQQDGAINVATSGGTSPYSYSWNNGSSTEDLTGLSQGTYSLVVTDSKNCSVSISKVITEPQPLNAQITYTSNFNGYGIQCYGDTNGFANLTVTGGTNPYFFSWSNGSTDIDLYNASAGSYYVTVTDNKNCTSSAFVALIEPPALVVDLDVNGISCYSANDGSASVNISGGVPVVTTLWSYNGSTGSSINNLAPGSYWVEVKDANLCFFRDSFAITEPPELILTCSQDTIVCSNTQANAYANAGGGVPPYNYFWNNAPGLSNYSTTPSSSVLLNVHVIDSVGCNSGNVAVNINVFPPVNLSISTVDDSVCVGSPAVIDAVISGGMNGQNSLYYNNQLISSPFTVLPNATQDYILMAQDSCHVKAYDTIRIFALPIPMITAVNYSNVLCNGANTGSINIDVNGGVPAYSYMWSNLAQTQDLSNVGAGTYTVNIIDANLCETSDTIVITEPPALNINCSVDTTVCRNSNIIKSATASGGVQPYFYFWNNQPGTQQLSMSMQSDTTVTVFVKDGNNCYSDTLQTSVNVLPSVNLIVTASDDTICYGQQILINAGITGAYNGLYTITYNNNPVIFPYMINPSSSGSMIFTATDTCGYESKDTITYVVHQRPMLSAVTVTDVKCYGESTGSVNISISGGTQPYSYYWSNLNVTEDLVNVTAGSYYLSVSDLNNCSFSETFVVTQPTDLVLTSLGNHLVCYNTSLQLSTAVSGGVPTYSYFWNGVQGGAVNTINAIGDTTISLVVKDFNNCVSDTVKALVSIAERIKLSVASTSDSVCSGASVQFVASIIGSYNAAYLLELNNQPVTSPYSLIPVSSQYYYFSATDTCGYSDFDTLKVEVLPLPLFSGIVQNVKCNGESTGGVDITISGGTPPYTTIWSNTSVNEDLTNVPVGSYSLQVKDKYNCNASNTFTISQPSPLQISGSPNMMVCRNSTVQVIAIVSGGTQPYFYYWNSSPGLNINNIQILGDTTISYFVKDFNDCFSDTINTIINTAPSVKMTVSLDDDSICIGGTANVSAMIYGSYSGPYTVTYNNSVISLPYAVSPTSNSSYIFIAKDTCNNSFSDTASVIVLPVPAISNVIIDNATCFNSSDGNIDITVTGGNSPYTYFWNPAGSSEDLTNVQAGNYSVQVRDKFNCTATGSYVVTQPGEILVDIPIDSLVCRNTSVNIISNISGGNQPYSFFWNNVQGQSSNSVLVISDTIVSCHAIDAGGCSSDTVEINISISPSVQIVANAIDDTLCIGESTQIQASSFGQYSGAYSVLLNNQPVNMPFSVSPIASLNYIVTAKDTCNVSYSDTVAIVVFENPSIVSPIITNVKCNNGSDGKIDITVSGGNPAYTYLWSYTSSGEDLVNVPAGNYSVIVRDKYNCTAYDTFLVSEPTELEITGPIGKLVCKNSDADLTAAATGGVAPYTYFWNGNQSSNSFTVRPIGDTTIYIYAMDANNCVTDSVSTIITVFPGISLSSFAISDMVCAGSTTEIYSLVSGGVLPYVLYDESNAVIQSPYLVTPLTTHNWVITAMDSCNSKATDTVLIRTIPIPNISVEADIYEGCQPLTVVFTGVSQPESMHYLWNFGENDAVSMNKNPKYTFTEPGVYDVSLAVTTQEGCEQSLLIPGLIKVFARPDARFHHDPIYPSILTPTVNFFNNSEGSIANMWSFGDGDSSGAVSPLHTYGAPGDYNVTLVVQSEDGCRDTTEVILTVHDEFAFYAPTSFTPDYNGLNDEFKVFAYGVDPNRFTLYIYNRWGEIIFKTNKLLPSPDGGMYTEPWNGRFNNTGPISQIDTYTWLVIYNDKKGAYREKAGAVTIIR